MLKLDEKISKKKVLSIMLLIVSVTELLIMISLDFLNLNSPLLEMFLDSLFLTLISTPFFYYLLINKIIFKNQDLTKDLLRQKKSLDMAVLVSEADLKGTITYVNNKFCELSKYSSEEIIGNNYGLINSGYHPSELWRECWEIINRGEIFKAEICNRAKDGKLYWLETSILPMFDKNKKIVGFSSIQLDVTLKKESEEKEKDHNRKLSFLGKIATEIGHEINTPLGIIQMSAGLGRVSLLEECRDIEEIKNSFDTIEETVIKISEIVSGLKIIGRASDNKILPINAYESISILCKLMQAIYKIDEVYIQIKAPFRGLGFVGDHGKFQQVITNLLANARDALMERDDIRREINISIRSEQNELIILISDNANGIDPVTLGKIFRENFTTKEIGQGTGIGLSISRGIIQEMGGELQVSSTLGGGSTFTLSLPLVDQIDAVDIIDKEKSDDYKLYGEILIVDDDSDMRALLTKVIRSFGCVVNVASDGESALKIIKEKKIEVLITDLRMPKMDGPELLEKIKQMPKTNMKIIVLSGEVSLEVQAEEKSIFIEMVNISLKKPIRRSDIHKALADLL